LWLSSLTNLGELLLPGNDLHGTIPSALGSLTSLNALWLFSNSLSGTIPTSLSRLTYLRALMLGPNNFSGTIPSSFSRLTNMRQLYLNGSGLCGDNPIPHNNYVADDGALPACPMPPPISPSLPPPPSPSPQPFLLPQGFYHQAGVVTTLVGSGSYAFADGVGTSASFYNPFGVALDANGTAYVADASNSRIRKITSARIVTTLAGSGNLAFADGAGASASFFYPYGVAVDASGTVYVADTSNHRIRKITSAGVVTTLAGSGSAAFVDGIGTSASFNNPTGIAVDASGAVYVADQSNNRIRTVTSAGVVTTLAGSGSAAFVDGIGTSASFNNPSGVAVDANGTVYVADYFNNRIRTVTSAGVVTTLAGSGSAAFADGAGTSASFNTPSGVAVDSSGTVYVADYVNNRIRKISEGVVTTLAGSGNAAFADGTGTSASFIYPFGGIAVDATSGTVYASDQFNSRIRIIQ